MCGDHSIVVAIQKFRERQPSPLPTMHPAIVNIGGFVMQVQRLVKLKTDTYMTATDTNKAWEACWRISLSCMMHTPRR